MNVEPLSALFVLQHVKRIAAAEPLSNARQPASGGRPGSLDQLERTAVVPMHISVCHGGPFSSSGSIWRTVVWRKSTILDSSGQRGPAARGLS